MKKLGMNEMEKIEAGAVETCGDFYKVLNWLKDNGHRDQEKLMRDTYYNQYCGAVDPE